MIFKRKKSLVETTFERVDGPVKPDLKKITKGISWDKGFIFKCEDGTVWLMMKAPEGDYVKLIDNPEGVV